MRVEIDRPIRTGFMLGIGACLALALVTFALSAFELVARWDDGLGEDNPLGSMYGLLLMVVVSAISIALVRSKPSSSTAPPRDSE